MIFWLLFIAFLLGGVYLWLGGKMLSYYTHTYPLKDTPLLGNLLLGIAVTLNGGRIPIQFKENYFPGKKCSVINGNNSNYVEKLYYFIESN